MSLARFSEQYAKDLAKARETHPSEYPWSACCLPDVVKRMSESFQKSAGKGSVAYFNKDSRAIKATCKALGIKHTYTAINEFNARSS